MTHKQSGHPADAGTFSGNGLRSSIGVNDVRCVDERSGKRRRSGVHVAGATSNSFRATVDKHDRGTASTDFLYTRHAVTLFMVTVAILTLMMRFQYHYSELDAVSSVKLGAAASSITFIMFGAVFLPDSFLLRPHPGLWRVVLAIATVYMIMMSFILFQSLSTVRYLLRLYDPSLANPLPEAQYAEDCRIVTADNPFHFYNTVCDVFIFAHMFGYFVKTLILRDWRASTCLSVGFEIVEITFQHNLSNFKECWWDHIFLDVLICNAMGTLLGMVVLRKLRAKEYNWVTLYNVSSHGTVRSVFEQLGPLTFLSYEWNVFLTAKRFVVFFSLLALFLLHEMNTFTMKHVLQLPTKHHLVVIRLAMWSLISVPSVGEYYRYFNMKTPASKCLGPSVWVSALVLLLETSIVIKFAIEGHHFMEPMPVYIAVPWVMAIVLFVVWFSIFFGVLSVDQRLSRRGFLYCLCNLLFYSGCFCVTVMFAMGMPDLQIGRNKFDELIAPLEPYILFWR
ncbi:putative Phosphatidyl serine synthase [Trypanosoma vivax]|uniref:Putative phosphatidylserine synthase n=1 Tax=Trypanosoma vivax (strain Y486) TaxID=1055687 RepID=G0TYJ1_TRYVY|nr:putative phosphatidylserine synthase [Trypanosoma vivax]KAH8611966.1 putative Phosphatidyl serine synthase [Trypanosoma vivax]CCC49038.1 putative phosphatidylserine synthase [Trypanosoma vivax Y486]